MVFLNLKIRGARLAKVRIKKPISDDENGPDVLHGAAEEMRLEPCWDVFVEPKVEFKVDQILDVFSDFDVGCELRNPIFSYIAQIT